MRLNGFASPTKQRRSAGIHISRLYQIRQIILLRRLRQYCACIEFHLDEGKRRGFYTSQFIESAGPDPDAEDDKIPRRKNSRSRSPPPTCGARRRLGLLADKLQENDLAAVRALAKRYADVDRHTPFVASIVVTSIEAGKDRNSPK